MMVSLFLPLFAFLAVFCYPATAQNETASAPTLADILLPTLNPPNDALIALFSTDVVFMQTPLAIRYSLFIAAARHEVRAACHPVALSFFGTKDPISSKFCTLENIRVISAYVIAHVLQSQFPLDAITYGAFLTKVGLKPFSTSTDMSTREGWANVRARRLLDYFENDGWNALGEVNKKHFRQPYADYTGYRPENPAHLRSDKLRRPLRWQPLQFRVDERGDYGYQQHVVPHIGLKGKPLMMSRRQLTGRRVDPPYETPNRRRVFSKTDKKKMLRLIMQLFDTSASLTDEQLALAAFWENKFFSVATFSGFYQKML